MRRPYNPRGRFRSRGPQIRIDGWIRAREVRVIGVDQKQLGVMPTKKAIALAQSHGVNLVEIVPNADPPVCRIVDYGKYRYEQSKKQKETKKHQHSNKLKEIHLSPVIDPHDFGIKLQHAVEFLCEDMKVKVALRFKGRQMAHKEIGFEVMQKFVDDIKAWGQPDAPPKMIGRSINLMLSPLPRNKRAANPYDDKEEAEEENSEEESGDLNPNATSEQATG